MSVRRSKPRGLGEMRAYARSAERTETRDARAARAAAKRRRDPMKTKPRQDHPLCPRCWRVRVTLFKGFPMSFCHGCWHALGDPPTEEARRLAEELRKKHAEEEANKNTGNPWGVPEGWEA